MSDLGFSLYIVLFICYVVTTLDGKKSKMKVSANWCVTIEYQRLSSISVKIVESGLSFFLFFFLFLFPFQFIFHFSIFRTLGLGLEVIGYTVTSVTSNSVVTTLIMGLKRKE